MSKKNTKCKKDSVMSINELMALLARVSNKDDIKITEESPGGDAHEVLCVEMKSCYTPGDGASTTVTCTLIDDTPDLYIPDLGRITTDGESITLWPTDTEYDVITLHFSRQVTEKFMVGDL